MRVVRLRPALIFKGDAASEIRRLFAGPFLPGFLVNPRLIPFAPRIPGLRFQAVHSLDVGDAYRRAAVTDIRATPERRRSRPGPPAWRLRLQPTPPGWLTSRCRLR
jgi:hypothetical protein